MKTLKRIGIGIGGLAVIIALVACSGSVDNDTVEVEAPAATIVEATTEPEAGVDYPHQGQATYL